jgi:hypothetical protein
VSFQETNATEIDFTRYDLETLRSAGSNEAKVLDMSVTTEARRCLSKPWAVSAALPDPTLCDSVADLDSLTVSPPVAGKT